MLQVMFRIIFPIFGIMVIFFQLSNLGGDYHGLDSPFWGLLLGIGLIFTPFKAIGMLFYYLLMILCIVGFPILGAYIGVEISGKDSFGVIVGLLLGGLAGFNLVISDFFDILSAPLRRLTSLDDN